MSVTLLQNQLDGSRICNYWDLKKMFRKYYSSQVKKNCRFFLFKLKWKPISGIRIEKIKINNRKKPLLLVKDYTFAQTTSDHRYWNCSRKASSKCNAKLRFNDSGKLIHCDLGHSHSPPIFFRKQDGTYVKIWILRAV